MAAAKHQADMPVSNTNCHRVLQSRMAWLVYWVTDLFVVVPCSGSRWRLCRWENQASVLSGSSERRSCMSAAYIQPLQDS